MEHDLAYYQAIQNATGSASAKESLLWEIKREVTSSFNKPLDWFRVTVGVTGVEREQELQIISTDDETMMRVFSKPNEQLLLGELVCWHGSYWLVKKLNINNDIRYEGELHQCNTLLRWQDENGTIQQCFASSSDASKYGTGVDKRSMMMVGEFNVKACVPHTEETIKITRDKRFLLGQYGTAQHPMAFIVTRINIVTNTYEFDDDNAHDGSGYIEWTLSEDQYRPNADNGELGIADYVEPTQQQVEPDDESGWF